MKRKNTPVQKPSRLHKTRRIGKFSDLNVPGPSKKTTKQMKIMSSSSSSSSSSSTIGNADNIIPSTQVGNLPLYRLISGADLNDLFQQEDRLHKILILDCRGTIGLTTERIKNAHILPSPNISQNERFAKKADVMRFFLDNLYTHIFTINVPGFYDKIILYDDHSISKSICQPLKIMMGAICRWNAGLKTEVRYLQGGFQSVKKNFPDLLTITNETVPPQEFPPIIQEFPEDTSTFSLSQFAAETLEVFQRYLSALEETVGKSARLLAFVKKVKIFEGINKFLKKEEIDELKKMLDLCVLNDYKCQECKEIFSGEIYQCGKGHYICLECSEKHFEECTSSSDTSHQKMNVRCLTLERQMATQLTVKCPNDNGCGKTLLLNQVSGHVVDCVKIRGRLGRAVEDETAILRANTGYVKEQLENKTVNLEDLKEKWSRLMEKDDVPLISRNFAKQLYTTVKKLDELRLAITLEKICNNKALYLEP